MIDINYLSDNLELVIKQLTNRCQDFTYLKEAVDLNAQRKQIIFDLETKQEEHNKRTKIIASLISENKFNEIEKIKDELVVNKHLISVLNERLVLTDDKITNILLKTPNIPAKTVPIGKSEAENVEIRKWGQVTSQNQTPHWKIATDLNIIDFERATKIAGTRFVIYKNKGALLLRAIISFLLDQHTKNGYEEMVLPNIVNEDTLIVAGNLPKFKADLFQLQEEKYFLIPTAEAPLVSLHQGEIIDGKLLPFKYCAYTPCYRSEAGAAGKDTRGIIRLHQFHKVELVKFVKPEASYQELELLTNDAENILKLLDLPYRVIELCSGDLGFHSAKTYDIEVWLPSQNKYREISSCSNCEDFQARRGKIRFKTNPTDKAQLVHTLNGSGLAIDRLIAAILENNYQVDGTVKVPKLLQKYMNGIKIISR